MIFPLLRFAALLIVFAAIAPAQTPVKYSLRDRGQQRSFEAVAEAGSVVLYESGRVRTPYARRRVTGKVLVRLINPADAPAFAALAGASAWHRAPVLEDAFLFHFPGAPVRVLAAAESMRALPGVILWEPMLARRPVKRWVPNDPFFAHNAANAGYQWHLKNTGDRGGLAGVDINITSAWNSWRGAGVRIGILDDGLQLSHPDLAANVDTKNDYDWNGNDDDPSPGPFDNHGTCCAGVAAGIGDNGMGVCGVAPEATVVGMRLISPDSTDATESAAFLHRSEIIQIKSNSWGPDDSGSVVEGPGTLAAAALQQAAETGRDGRGTLFVWAAGNGLAFGDDSNFDGYANSIYSIAVTGVTDSGHQPNYAEPGANILIAAPSDGGAQDISTTDRTGAAGYNSGGGGNFASPDYHNGFGGTSAAAAVVSGGLAVLLQARPALGWRDVKEILIRSAVKVSPGDAGWFDNGAGFHFNDKFGAGLLDVSAALGLAAAWPNLGPLVSQSLESPEAVAIPDNAPAGVIRTFTFPPAQNLRVEQIALSVSVTHPRRGQLEFRLTSPTGTVVRLARQRPDNIANLTWTFTSPQFWGEPAAGDWTLRVSDAVSMRTGTLNSAALTLHGTEPDADGDGFPAGLEAYFGTSDASADSFPSAALTSPDGVATVTFTAVPGNAYVIEVSADMLEWTTYHITAEAESAIWTDPVKPAARRHFYRVRRP
jgi:subtilisin-like proprotein convertase family protein